MWLLFTRNVSVNDVQIWATAQDHKAPDASRTCGQCQDNATVLQRGTAINI